MKKNNGKQHRIIHAGAVRDAVGTALRSADVYLIGDRIAAVGSHDEVGVWIKQHFPNEEPEHLSMPDRLVLPALVNAHAHLDLTHIGPIPFDGDFAAWADRVRADRATEPRVIEDSVRLGIELSLIGGTGIVGDIAGNGSTVPAWTLASQTALRGVSFIEFFGLGDRQNQTIERMRECVEEWIESDDDTLNRSHYRFGLQPHAPYSAGPGVYRAAVELARKHDLCLSTHLSETREEEQFTRSASGALADLVRRIGKWDDSITSNGQHPIDHLAEVLKAGSRDSGPGWIAAHVNYADDSHLDQLAETKTTVAYCPRTSDYFGHRKHRYREMTERNVRVALGTDSIVGLDTPDRISVLDEMSYLYQRDGTDPDTLLSMATTVGAVALGFDPALVTLSPGQIAGLIAMPFDPDSPIDPLRQVLAGQYIQIEWVSPMYRHGR